jgi:hypothetical protein
MSLVKLTGGLRITRSPGRRPARTSTSAPLSVSACVCASARHRSPRCGRRALRRFSRRRASGRAWRAPPRPGSHGRLPKLWTSCRRPPDSPRVPCEPVSVCNRTGLRPAEREIEKWRPETGAQNPPRTDRNTDNYRPETGIRQRNPRECRRFSPTGK